MRGPFTTWLLSIRTMPEMDTFSTIYRGWVSRPTGRLSVEHRMWRGSEFRSKRPHSQPSPHLVERNDGEGGRAQASRHRELAHSYLVFTGQTWSRGADGPALA